jgi:hypothetical protein
MISAIFGAFGERFGKIQVIEPAQRNLRRG